MANFNSIEDVQQFARARGACSDAREWLLTQETPEMAWNTCERSDWMIWLAGRRGIERKTLVRIACACARTSLRFVPEGEDRPRIAIETAERWCDDQATIQEVRAAADAAYPADAAYAYAAAVVYAADAYAVYAVYAADAADAADAARRQANIQMCNIIREYISFADIA